MEPLDIKHFDPAGDTERDWMVGESVESRSRKAIKRHREKMAKRRADAKEALDNSEKVAVPEALLVALLDYFYGEEYRSSLDIIREYENRQNLG